MALFHLRCDFNRSNPALAKAHVHRCSFDGHLAPNERLGIALAAGGLVSHFIPLW